MEMATATATTAHNAAPAYYYGNGMAFTVCNVAGRLSFVRNGSSAAKAYLAEAIVARLIRGEEEETFKTWSQPPEYIPLQYSGVSIISTLFTRKMMVWDCNYQVKANHKDLLKLRSVPR